MRCHLPIKVNFNPMIFDDNFTDGRPRLNIVDILKPADEVGVGELEVEETPEPTPAPRSSAPSKVVIPFPEESENVTRWIVDQNFRKEQERLKIPFGRLVFEVR